MTRSASGIYHNYISCQGLAARNTPVTIIPEFLFILGQAGLGNSLQIRPIFYYTPNGYIMLKWNFVFFGAVPRDTKIHLNEMLLIMTEFCKIIFLL